MYRFKTDLMESRERNMSLVARALGPAWRLVKKAGSILIQSGKWLVKRRDSDGYLELHHKDTGYTGVSDVEHKGFVDKAIDFITKRNK
jgi:hypothetical protein